jgi:hypothetical protein
MMVTPSRDARWHSRCECGPAHGHSLLSVLLPGSTAARQIRRLPAHGGQPGIVLRVDEEVALDGGAIADVVRSATPCVNRWDLGAESSRPSSDTSAPAPYRRREDRRSAPVDLGSSALRITGLRDRRRVAGHAHRDGEIAVLPGGVLRPGRPAATQAGLRPGSAGRSRHRSVGPPTTGRAGDPREAVSR